ncbi:occludin/ELL domain-containing protein 1, partial [Dipodomys spectabilis]|uniref:occludin/ELL domain-containing protein 1 n=1 Tax=Dipodomys spectabilis TaxID=105255 RepID=UPI001C548B75
AAPPLRGGAPPPGGQAPPRGRRVPPEVKPPPDSGHVPAADPGWDRRTLGQAARRPRPPRAGPDAPRRPARGPQSGAPARPMPTREHPRPRPPGPGPPTAPPRGQPARPRKIAFADELPSRALPGAGRRAGAGPGGRQPRAAAAAPDYELRYPALRSERGRRRYAAVFRDQRAEFLELRRDVEAARARLARLEALLGALPPARSQEEAQAAARVWREIEKKRTDPGFLDKQARCRYLKGKLRHLKAQIQKFDDQDSEASVYF